MLQNSHSKRSIVTKDLKFDKTPTKKVNLMSSSAVSASQIKTQMKSERFDEVKRQQTTS